MISFLVDVGILCLVELYDVLVLVPDVLEALAFVDFNLAEHVALLFVVSILHLLDLLLDCHVHLVSTRGASGTSSLWGRTLANSILSVRT